MTDEFGLFTGKIAELIAYYELDESDSGDYSDPEIVFDSILNYFFQTSDYSFCSGKSGILLGLCFLEKKGWLAKDNLGFLNDEYEIIYNSIKKDIEHGNFDLLYGATGKLYVLMSVENPFTEKAIASYMQGLENHLIRNQDMAFMFETFMSKKKDEVVNLGLAHGLTSIFILLTEIADKEKSTNVKTLLNDIAAYFLSLKKQESLSVYPSNITLGIPDYNSPFGWCYGDLGIAIAFFNLYIVSRDKAYYEEARFLATSTAEKIIIGRIKYEDDFICHGSSGVILMLFQLNSQFNLPVIQTAIDALRSEQTLIEHKIEGGLISGKTGIILTHAFIDGKIDGTWSSPLLLTIKNDINL